MAKPPRILLIADDYAQSEGISAAIRRLAAAGRLSGTSAMTNMAGWAAEGPRLADLRARFSVGLHLTLTHGAPLGALPRLAPDGRLPGLDTLLRLALTRRLRTGALAREITDEIARQLDAFEAVTGAPPDHVDGHQHVHVLPGVLGPLTRALAARYPGRPILLRDPRDRPGALMARGAAGKAAFVAFLSSGLGRAAHAAGLPRNHGFSGFSDFGATPYADEFPSFLSRLGPQPMIMCHPGEGADPDDPIAARRPEELAYLETAPDLPARLWLPRARAPGAPIDWSGLGGQLGAQLGGQDG